ncbi:MAG TPA: GntR family transcriptional regulator [Terracidiphilus sp.]|nr:GntR family transcriptional regulator [Terracidiphilus sp.]
MRLWFSPGSEVPLYRQLVTQVVLAILSGDLQPGARLPSTRELARRFSIHPNTVSAGYRQLARDGWVEYRHGSGVYIKGATATATTAEQILDQHIAAFFRAVRELRLPAAAIRQRVAEWVAAPPPDHFLLVDPDPAAREILLTEIRQATAWPVAAISVEEAAKPEALLAAIPLCRPSQAKMVRALLPAGIELVTLQIRSANKWLDPELPSLKGRLIGVVSSWEDFREIARTMLAAAGVDPDLLVVRNPVRPRWRHGLEQTGAILCDAHTAATRELPKGPRVFVFSLLADAARTELREFPGSSQFS